MKVMVVAFDGFDYELIKEFGLEAVKQDEFGKIDNSTGMSSIKTSELFASFITGTTHKNHKVEGLSGYVRPKKGKILDTLAPEFLSGNRGFYTWRNILEEIIKPREKKYDNSMWDYPTLFDKIQNSRAIFVPSYNPSPYWVMGADLGNALKFGYSGHEALDIYDEIEFPHRKNKILTELENEILPTRDFLMCHFHRPDTYQHVFGDFNMDKKKLEKMYFEMDDLAKEIKEKAIQKGYDLVIFMSDHGLPSKEGHNENAFYSSNKPLFNEVPKITQFHDKILELNKLEK